MKKLLILVAMMALVASAGLAQEKQYDVPGAFSFTYGDGWSKGPRKGGSASELDWLVNTSNPKASFHAVLAHADFSYDDWINRTIKSATPERALVSKAEFESVSGEKGYKMVWKIKTSDGQQYVTDQYLFRGKKDSQIMLNGTVDAASADSFSPQFDTFAKSLQVNKGK